MAWLLLSCGIVTDALSARWWSCFGPMEKDSDCPFITEPGYEVMMPNGLTSDPESDTVFTVSWTYTCWINPRPDLFNDPNVVWANDFDPVWCPTFECGAWNNLCHQPSLVLPGKWCPAIWQGINSMCPYQQGIDKSVNGTGIWLSSFTGSDASRLWRVRIDGWNVSMSGSVASCVGPASLRLMGQTIIMQCLLMLHSTGDVLRSTLLLGIDANSGVVLWQELLAVGPVLSSGQPSWTQPIPGSPGVSSFIRQSEVTGGRRYLSLTYAKQSDLYAPRWCAQKCLIDPICTAWNMITHQYTPPTCELYSGASSLRASTITQLSGLITTRPSWGQLCTTTNGGVCAARFQYTQSANYFYSGAGCMTTQGFWPFPGVTETSYNFCCTTPVCSFNQATVGWCGKCTGCALPDLSSGPVSRILAHDKSGTLFIPDPVGSKSIQINSRTGAHVRKFNAESPEWRRNLNSTCYGARDFVDTGYTPPVLADLPDGTTLMIGRANGDMPSRLVAINIQTGALAWTFDLPIDQFEYQRILPGFIGFGKPNYLYYTALWMGTSAPCNLVIFRVSATALTYETRFSAENICWTDITRGGSVVGGVDPNSGRVFFMTTRPSRFISYDTSKAELVNLPWLANEDVPEPVSWKPLSDSHVLMQVAVGFTPSKIATFVMSPFDGSMSAKLTNRESTFNFIDYTPGKDNQAVVTTSNGRDPGTSRLVVWGEVPADPGVQLGATSKTLVILFAIIASVGNLFLLLLKAGLKMRSLHDGYVQMGSSKRGGLSKWEVVIILLSMLCSGAVLGASGTQKAAVVSVIQSWRNDIGLSTFSEFQHAHIRPQCPTPSSTYDVDLCTCTPDGPCQDKQFLNTCGVMSQTTCANALIHNCACDLALYGYTCACSVGMSSCTITVQPNSNNSTQTPPYLPSATQGFNQCVDHYDAIAKTMDSTLRNIIFISLGALGFELLRIACFFCNPGCFVATSYFSSIVSFACTAAIASAINKVSGMTETPQPCTSTYGFLTRGLPGCAFVNVGVIRSAEIALDARVHQCIALFVASPVMLGLQGGFVFLQQLVRGCKR